MRCLKCGNEISLGEAYCGQCGTPIAAPQALQTEMVNTPPPPSGRLNSYPPQRTFGAQTSYGAPLNTEGTSLPPSSSPTPQLPQQPTASQGTGFYRDATEAMSVLPSNPNAGYQQPYPTTPPSNVHPPTPANYGYPGQPPPQQAQPLQTGNYVGQGYPQQPIPERQGYRSVPTPPQKQQNGAVIFFVSICLVIALLSVVGIGTLYIIKGRNTASKNTQGLAPTATLAPTVVPTPTATTEPTATTVPTSTPTVVPTAPPVAGFAYCGPSCVTNGFSTQYPQGWSAIPLTGIQGIQFVNPNPTDQSATFKTPGATTSSPNNLVANDLQQNFASKDGYAVVTPASTASLGGETWFEEVITYQGATQKEHVEVYANVHQGKAYILELQASEDQFTTVTTQYFTTITREFQFQ